MTANTRPDFAETTRLFVIDHPTRLCPDFATHRPGAWETCRTCRGFGHVSLSLDEVRVAYAECRAAGMEILGCTPEEFDDLARARLEDGVETPGRWLAAARDLSRKGPRR